VGKKVCDALEQTAGLKHKGWECNLGEVHAGADCEQCQCQLVGSGQVVTGVEEDRGLWRQRHPPVSCL
jgi:hypothetical protein